MTDKMDIMFTMQEDLQRIMPPFRLAPADLPEEDRALFIRDMVFALADELHEVLGEVGWKPWATSRHVNIPGVKSELIDCWHFFMNLCLAVGFTPDQIFAAYTAKHQKNVDRQEKGYDGLADKCPDCHRAYDDEYVTCKPGYCADNQ